MDLEQGLFVSGAWFAVTGADAGGWFVVIPSGTALEVGRPEVGAHVVERLRAEFPLPEASG